MLNKKKKVLIIFVDLVELTFLWRKAKKIHIIQKRKKEEEELRWGWQKEEKILNKWSSSALLTRRHVSKDLEEMMKESIRISLGSTPKAEKNQPI